MGGDFTLKTVDLAGTEHESGFKWRLLGRKKKLNGTKNTLHLCYSIRMTLYILPVLSYGRHITKKK